MYAGTTLHKHSGNLVGAHQKMDRAARTLVEKYRPNMNFPTSRQIIRFEGNNGPDGLKRKSSGVDEPWHFWDPAEPSDQAVLKMISVHQTNIVTALRARSYEKVAFEAAWLAHAITDGLTPAHHYPFEEKLNQLRDGQGLESRTSVKEKIILKGDTRRKTINKNWQMWGSKGLMLSHGVFEWGISAIAMSMRLTSIELDETDITYMAEIGLVAFVQEQALAIHKLDIYRRYLRRGWGRKLNQDIRNQLLPRITKTIALAWICAIDEASKGAPEHS